MICINISLLSFFLISNIFNFEFFNKLKIYDKIANFLEIYSDSTFSIQNKYLHQLIFPENINDANFEVFYRSNPLSFLGGDFVYQGKDFNNGYWFGIGDSSGHDINSHLFSMSILLKTSYFIHKCDTPKEVNKEINSSLDMCMNQNKLLLTTYASFLLFKADQDGRFIHYGHHPNFVIYRKQSEKIEIIETSGNFVGLELSKYKDDQGSFTLGEGDILFAFTDGIFEQKSKQGKYYGTHLYNFIQYEPKDNLKKFSDNLFIALQNHTENKIMDDMSLLIIRKK
jgi:serine phosphatase RsbU (regulator of sigma subunit)